MKNKKILLANSLLLIAFLLFIGIPMAYVWLFKIKSTKMIDGTLLLSGAISVVVLGGVSLLYCKFTNQSFNEVAKIKGLASKQVFFCMITAIGTMIFAMGINLISGSLFHVVVKEREVLSNIITKSSFMVGVLVVICIPAFFEELFFRGVLLNAYEGLNKKLKYFLIILIFATFHGNIMQISYVLFLGYVLLKVREYTDSLLGSMLLHATNNGISYIMSKIAAEATRLFNKGASNGMTDAASMQAMPPLPAAIAGASIFLLIGGTILFLTLGALKKYKEEKEESEFIEDKTSDFESEVEIKEKPGMLQYVPLALYFIFIIGWVVTGK